MPHHTPKMGRRRLRRLILGRSVVVGILASVPVPQVEDALRAAVRRGLLRRLASLRQVDVEDDALDTLVAESDVRQRVDTMLALGNILVSLRDLGRPSLRRMLFGALSLRRFDQMLRTYEQASLFDHYCARHHLGPGIDPPLARRLRKDFDQAAKDTHGEVVRGALDAVAGGAWRTLGAVAGQVTATLREHRMAAGPVLLSTAATAVTALVSDARARATSLGRGGPRALWARVQGGLDRYSAHLATAYDHRVASVPRAPQGDGDDDDEGGR